MKPIEQFEADHAQPRLTNYPLSLSSVVFDVGGYKGDWTAELIERGRMVCKHCGAQQNPYIYIFEPIKEFANICKERFKDYPKVKVFPFGLYCANKIDERIKLDEAASSLVAVDPSQPIGGCKIESVDLVDIKDFVYQQNIKRIDLISINIEGAEYYLLNQMLCTGIASMCKNIQVQFHQLGEYEGARENIRQRLSLTHKENFCYPYVWESWSLK